MAGTRISGLASGMDIDSIVSDMMKAKRIPLDKLKQKKQVMEWQRDDYRSMNTLLLSFRSELTQMKLTTKYRTRTTTTTDESKVTATATSAASLSSYTIQSVEQLATAATKINAGKISGASKIDPTKELFLEKGKFSRATDFDSDNWKTGSVETKLFNAPDNGNTFSLDLHNGVKIKAAELANMNVKVNGVAYTVVTTGTPTDNQVLVDINGNLTFGSEIDKGSTIKADFVADNKVDTFKLTDNISSINLTKGSISSIEGFKVNGVTYTISGNEIKDGTNTVAATIDLANGTITNNNDPTIFSKDSTIEVTYKQNYFNFKLGSYNADGKLVSENFNIQGSESLNGVINKVNSSAVGVSMFYDPFTDQVTLTRSETGDFKKADTNDMDNPLGEEIITSGNFIDTVLKFKTQLEDESGDPTGGYTKEQGGENAIFTLNGLKTERNSNVFDINGVTFTLKKEFTSDSPITIAINNDSNKVFENIKGFIDKYNELIGKVQGELQEERYKSYTPLTDQQRESLSDKQQEQWEEKAKSGMLRRDPTLTSLLSSMRTDFYGSVQSDNINPLFDQLSKIGIKTTANYLEGGKLEIDEAKLKKAIEEDPESVESLFNASGTSTGQKGIAQRLYDTVGKTMDVLYEKAGKSFWTNNQYTMGKQLNDLNSQIDRFEDRLSDLEDRYYRQFTAMEKAIQKANSQSSYIMQNFSK